MNGRQTIFFMSMCGGFLVAITIVFLIAGILPPASDEDNVELMAVYAIPMIIMYVLVQLNPKLIDRVFDKGS